MGDNKFYYSNLQPDLATAVVVKQLGGKSKFKKFVEKNLNLWDLEKLKLIKKKLKVLLKYKRMIKLTYLILKRNNI